MSVSVSVLNASLTCDRMAAFLATVSMDDDDDGEEEVAARRDAIVNRHGRMYRGENMQE
jgi:hypothetical protein